MKKLFILIAFVAISYSSNAQSSLQAQGVTSTIYGSACDPILSTSFDIYNSSANTLDVKVQLDEVSILPGATSSFCWGALCYGVGTYLSPVAASIAGTTVESSFVSDYYPACAVGISTLDYTFFDINNVPDAITVRIYYDTQSTGVGELTANNYLNVGYSANSNIVAVTYNLKNKQAAEIKMFDMLGNTLKKYPLNNVNGNLIISTVDIPSGVYFISLISNNKSVVNKKFAVNHR